MLRKIITVLMLATASMSAFAGENQSIESRGNELERSAVCYDYNYDPRTCNNLWYCEYDYRRNSCNYVDDNGGGGHYCSDYDRNPRGCNRQANCEWDRYSNRCEDSHDPYPSRCDYYRDWRSCDSVQECFWDRRLDRCVDAR